jgi:hypothetical protein
MKGIAMRNILVCGVILALAAFASQSVAQSSGTANSTPQYRESKPKNDPQIAAEIAAKNAARRQAAKEAARRFAEAGKQRAAGAARFVAKQSGLGGGLLGNPKKACAPAPGQEDKC